MKSNAGKPEGEKIRVMFVCLGNICRSPVAEGVFRSLVVRAGLESFFEIRSSGTGGWHVGEQADARMTAAAEARGFSLACHQARQFTVEDLASFDHILVMDKDNLHDVLALDYQDRYGHKVRLFREFDPEPDGYQVPDPYYGGPQGFDEVVRIADRTARMLLHRLVEEYDLPLRSRHNHDAG